MTETLLTVQEVAVILKIKEKTLYSWTAKRKIPFIKVNGETRFVQRHLDGWLEKRTVKSKVA